MADGIVMAFHVQLAHGSPTKTVTDFTNVQQLYENIAKQFGIQTGDIMYCTLNTHQVDMTKLLGGQIGLDDFLFAHVHGASKSEKVTKSGPALGLTISDNGAGKAFVKKIRDGSIMAASGVSVGDEIKSINGTALNQCRHFEVARMLKEIPIGSEFALELVSPQQGMAGVGAANRSAGSSNVAAGAGKKTLRMKKDGTAVVEDTAVADARKTIVDKINAKLVEHCGLEDDLLAGEIYDHAKACAEADAFGELLDDKLADFEFPDDFVLDVHEMATS
jgi:hypothetical protein